MDKMSKWAKICHYLGKNSILQPLTSFEFKDCRQITFEFLNRIRLLRGWEVKANLLRIGKLQTVIFHWLNKYFHEILYQPIKLGIINPTKIMELKIKSKYTV